MVSLPQSADEMFRDAEAYDRFMGRWSKRLAPVVTDFAALPEEGNILDLGCGTGALSFVIAERKPRSHVVGVDLSQQYVAFARRQNQSSRVSFQVGDAEQLPFARATFDASASLLVFNFLPDPRKALAELGRVTRPRGCVAAAVWDYGDGMQMLRIFWDAAVASDPSAEKLDEKHMPLCTAGELKRLWEQGGLTQVTERALEIEMPFRSFDDFWEPFLLGQGPAGAYVKRLAPDLRTALAESVKSRLRLQSPNQPFRLAARAWSVRGNVPA